MGCYGEPQVPSQSVVATSPIVTPAPATTTVVVRTTPPPPPPPPVPTVLTAVEPQPPFGAGQNVAPPPVGVTEMQPAPVQAESDEQTRVRQIVLLANLQIERLTRRESKAIGNARDDIDSVLTDLRSRRDKVEQDYRSLQAQPSAGAGATTAELDREIVGLRDAIDDSYSLEPPAGHGLPPPAPIPPSELP